MSTYSTTNLKRSALHFLRGKAASGVLTFTSILVVVRVLPLGDYGAYVTFVAAMELALALGDFGLPWIAARYLPEYRLRATGAVLQGLIYRLLRWQLSALLLVAGLLLLTLDAYLKASELQQYELAARLYLLVFVLDGFCRRIRDDLLGPLLLQGIAQISVVVRNTVFLAALLAVSAGGVALADVAVIEIAASLLGLTVALTGLLVRTSRFRGLTGDESWKQPHAGEMIRLARSMYLNQSISLLYGAQFILLILQRIAGTEAVAVLGFMRNLYDQVSRYLPATLLLSVVRPKLVASFVSEGGAAALSQNANFAGKLSLFVLMPLVAWVGVSGSALVSVLSSGRFPETGHLSLVFMLALVPVSQRQILETVAVTTRAAWLCAAAAVAGLAVLPMVYVAIKLGYGVMILPLALLLGGVVVNAVIVAGSYVRIGYRFDIPGSLKLLAMGFLDWAILYGVLDDAPLLLSLPLSIAIYLLMSVFVRPFSGHEYSTIIRFASLRT